MRKFIIAVVMTASLGGPMIDRTEADTTTDSTKVTKPKGDASRAARRRWEQQRTRSNGSSTDIDKKVPIDVTPRNTGDKDPIVPRPNTDTFRLLAGPNILSFTAT